MRRDCIRPASGSLLGMRHRTAQKQVVVSVEISQKQSLCQNLILGFHLEVDVGNTGKM